MNEKELAALISLLDDDDKEVVGLVEKKILSLGKEAIPFLEEAWHKTSMPNVQKKIEDLIHAMQFQTFRERLFNWVSRGGKDLLEGMWIIATYSYPDLTYHEIRYQMEQLFYDIWIDFKEEMHPADKVKMFNNIFFGKFNFKANTKNFYSVSNSMLNQVLETRTGNPISLCVVYMLLAQRLKMPIYGVNLPNLFILTYKDKNIQFYINTFNRGLIFTRQDVESYIKHLNLAHDESYYEPCSHIDIIRRTLKNLILSYEKIGDLMRMEEIQSVLDEMEVIS
ncbi:MAG: transglutaminase-like domain-containing protein [Cytophagales bacterium]|nr:transglutaminase-like domain-containing protein [Cytophagales bacterium]MDW8383429.1 transglutaminase-like domain-containing protein [Flammeovirgaceae bacterium]